MCRWSEFEHLNGKQVNHIYREWPIRGCVWWTRSHSCGGGPPGFRTRPPCRDLCSGRRCHPGSPTAERSDDSPFPLWSSPGTLWWPITGCRVTQIWSHCRVENVFFLILTWQSPWLAPCGRCWCRSRRVGADWTETLLVGRTRSGRLCRTRSRPPSCGCYW